MDASFGLVLPWPVILACIIGSVGIGHSLPGRMYATGEPMLGRSL